MIRYTISLFLTTLLLLISNQNSSGQNRQDSTLEKELIISKLESIDYPLPKDAKKLKPKQDEFKIQVGIHLSGYNLWVRQYHFRPTNISDKVEQRNPYYFDKPRLFQLDFAYQIKPWLKAGILTHRRGNLADEGLMNGQVERIVGYFNIEIDFERTWGAFVEFTPMPVTHLKIRRWEVNLGASINKENITVTHIIDGGYNLDLTRWGHFDQKNQRTYSLASSYAYTGIRIYLAPFLSLNPKVGYYFIPTIKSSGYTVSLPNPYGDVNVYPSPLNLSWHFYSLGLNLNL